MRINKCLLQGYEGMKLVTYKNAAKDFPTTVAYEDLPEREIQGVLKANRYVDGKLMQTYSEKENHVAVIAATRLGKTTSYAIPFILSTAKAKNKRSICVSDPKGELYRMTSETLRREGYKVLLINLRDATHSECWNPLTPIFRKYEKEYYNIADTVELVETPDGPRNKFRGVIYEDQSELDSAVERMKKIAFEDVSNDVDDLCYGMISTDNTRDPYWEDSARKLLKAIIHGMLEDIHPKRDNVVPVTEETFSFSTVLSIMDSMHDGSGTYYDDGGYFKDRGDDSMAYRLAKNCILENAPTTRKCIVACFDTKMSIYKSSAVRLITCCNSFKMDDLTNEKQPVAVFIQYKDESKAHYQLISSFVQNAYRHLIQYANDKKDGMLKNSFYFILDEFGNFPKIPDFETVISACGGRNIFFVLILQSYAQLNNVYGRDVAEIIRDNLNLHVFLGSNNPATLEEFSRECGETTRLSPVCALYGNKEEIEDYRSETIRLMPKSELSSLKPGDCIVTEANTGYVMYSRLERYYMCPEMNDLPHTSEKDYFSDINPLDNKYIYVREKKREKKRFSDFF